MTLGTHDTSTFLAGLSSLAGRSFASTDETIAAVLELLVEQLGMRSSFVSRIDRAAGRFELVASHNADGGCGIPPSGDVPLQDTF